MTPHLPEDLRPFARDLRRHQTDAEALLWFLLRDRRLAGMKFRRQHAFPPYIVDFYCHEARLVVELDGGQHNDPAMQVQDRHRTQVLEAQGVRVLRFWNHDVLESPESVLETILAALGPALTPDPSPSGRGVRGEGRHPRREEPPQRPATSPTATGNSTSKSCSSISRGCGWLTRLRPSAGSSIGN